MVLEAGRKALEKWEARAFRRDILYAMSLAHLGLASEALRAKEQARPCLAAQNSKCLNLSSSFSQPTLLRQHRGRCSTVTSNLGDRLTSHPG